MASATATNEVLVDAGSLGLPWWRIEPEVAAVIAVVTHVRTDFLVSQKLHQAVSSLLVGEVCEHFCCRQCVNEQWSDPVTFSDD